jgi:NAD(P)-dependent dehydrogenase (short-subunit alcohol dehydrogenase family)
MSVLSVPPIALRQASPVLATETSTAPNQTSPSEYLASLFSLEGKTAVVIGGTGVLGGAICDAFAGAGAYVIVSGRNEGAGDAVAQRWPGRSEFMPVDSTNRSELELLVSHLQKAGRQCDILLNGAGTNSATPFLEITDEEWDRILNINLKSVRLACQVFGKYMLDCKTRGSIINIASVSAELPLSRVFTYSASKAAVLNLTRNLAREWAALGIRVNAVSPGFFPAEQNRKVLTPDRVENIMRHTPMARFGSPHELAGAMVLLASDAGGSFMTGCNLAVDGGFTSMTI